MSQPPAPQRTTVLLQRVDAATEALVSNFKQIVDLSSNSGKERGYVASEVFQIESSATSLVRSAEELMFVTRSLKEAWILGQIKPLRNEEEQQQQQEGDGLTEDKDVNDREQQNTKKVNPKAEKLLDAILQES